MRATKLNKMPSQIRCVRPIILLIFKKNTSISLMHTSSYALNIFININLFCIQGNGLPYVNLIKTVGYGRATHCKANLNKLCLCK